MSATETKKMIEKILRTAEELVIELSKSKIDELQKAQILQSLVVAKLKLEELFLQLPDKQRQFFKNRYISLSKDIKDIMKDVDFVQVQGALERLSIGVGDLVKQTQNGSKVIKE